MNLWAPPKHVISVTGSVRKRAHSQRWGRRAGLWVLCDLVDNQMLPHALRAPLCCFIRARLVS